MELARMIVTGLMILVCMVLVSVLLKIVQVAINNPGSPIYVDFTPCTLAALVGFACVAIGFALVVFLVFIVQRIRGEEVY